MERFCLVLEFQNTQSTICYLQCFEQNEKEPASARLCERHRKSARVDRIVRYHLQVHVAGLRGARNDVVGSVQSNNVRFTKLDLSASVKPRMVFAGMPSVSVAIQLSNNTSTVLKVASSSDADR